MATSKSSKTEKTTTAKKSSFAENYGSTILGFIVVLILGSFLFNVFRGNNQDGQVGNGEENQNEEQLAGQKHVVAAGEDLWKISVKHYNTGYNWTDIAKANNITDANQIEEGMELVIPVVTPQGPTEIAQAPTTAPEATEAPTATVAPSATTAPVATAAVTTAPTVTAVPATVTPQPTQPASQGGTYTVQKGDSLWSIALAQYNDGYKWVEIAKANQLVNPDFIHVGNTLTLPR